MRMRIVRRRADKLLTRLKLKNTHRRDETKTSFVCPICSTKTTFTWKDFKNAQAALNKNSALTPEEREAFSKTSPLQRIESNVLGRRMPLFLEYALDFHCRHCGSPFRILFAVVEAQGPSFVVKSMLGPVRKPRRPHAKG